MKFHQLLKSKPSPPQNLAVANANGVADIYLYDVISADWGMAALDFVRLVAEAKASGASSIVLHINSPGGDVFEAAAMGAALHAANMPVTARIEGICASAATTLAGQCDTVEMVDGAFFMIHNSSSVAWGDRREMSKVGSLLEKSDAQIAAGYAKKTGKTIEELSALMDAETWYTATEAHQNGFVDAVISGPKPAAQWDLSAFANAPQQTPPSAPTPDAQSLAQQKQVNANRLRLLTSTV